MPKIIPLAIINTITANQIDKPRETITTILQLYYKLITTLLQLQLSLYAILLFTL